MLEIPAPVPPRRRPGDGGTTDGRSVCLPPRSLEDVEQLLWKIHVFRGRRVIFFPQSPRRCTLAVYNGVDCVFSRAVGQNHGG